jgi:phospholipid/cholesterol/gamma-HCH transport system permease protein
MFGAEIFIANGVAVGMVRVMGPLMTAIIMAGRTGAAFAAQLGTMQVNEEVDALQTMGFSPMEFLVLPRALALIIMMPLLTIYANVVGIIGGAIIGILMLDLTPMQYYLQTIGAIDIRSVASGLINSSVFGVLVAISGCMQGIRCGRSASAVGEATTAAVVNAIVYIVVANSIISVIQTITGF